MSNPSLLERVEAATGADREIDKELAQHLLGAFIRLSTTGEGWRYQMLLPDHQGVSFESLPDVPAYTSSLDAALSLVERVLPGWGVEVLTPDRDMWRATVWPWVSSRGTRDNVGFRYSYAKTPALALLAALLKATEEKPQP